LVDPFPRSLVDDGLDGRRRPIPEAADVNRVLQNPPDGIDRKADCGSDVAIRSAGSAKPEHSFDPADALRIGL
jgi:hypothetical protein